MLIFLAVSYTHLRAHETVLDLVCRVLLLKQNICKLEQGKMTDVNERGRSVRGCRYGRK
ncbi:hypothetical protein PVA38_10010 [Streptococcus pneumoniae D39]|nr:hypothetical protein PVA38_10010 [Streptococcus pneumoniae D39]